MTGPDNSEPTEAPLDDATLDEVSGGMNVDQQPVKPSIDQF